MLLGMASQVPAYGTLGAQSLEDFPLLTKDDIRANPSAYARKSLFPTSRQRTSGSTGTALRVSRSLGAVVFEQAVVDWVVAKAGLELRKCRVAVMRGIDIKCPSDSSGPFWRRSGNSLIVSSNHISRRTIGDITAALQAFGADVVLAYPSTIENFVKLMQASGLKWRCPLVVTSSEVLAPHTRRLIGETLAADVFDYYGQAERVACAYSIEDQVYWFLPTYSAVELLDTAEPGKSEIAGTPFHNTSQLLIRYRTGDYAQTGAATGQALAEIAAGRKPFNGIIGRSDDVLIASDGRVLVGIDHIPRGLEELGRFQVIQDAPDHVRILVQSDRSLAGEWSSRILARARLKIPNDISVAVEFVDELRMSATGKTPFVIREKSLSASL